MKLILTHAHFDYVANASAIRQEYNTRILIHRNDADHLQSGENPFPRGTMFLTRLFTDLSGKKIQPLINYEPVTCDISIGDEYSLEDIGFNAYIIHTPGHTAGCMSLIVDDEIAVVRDAMFGVSRHSVFPLFTCLHMEHRIVENCWKVSTKSMRANMDCSLSTSTEKKLNLFRL